MEEFAEIIEGMLNNIKFIENPEKKILFLKLFRNFKLINDKSYLLVRKHVERKIIDKRVKSEFSENFTKQKEIIEEIIQILTD